MPIGRTAVLTITFTGQVAVDPNAEIDLTVNAGGDNLSTDALGGILAVKPGATWPGRTAALSLSDITLIITETGDNLATEDGGTIATES